MEWTSDERVSYASEDDRQYRLESREDAWVLTVLTVLEDQKATLQDYQVDGDDWDEARECAEVVISGLEAL